ncbi:trigger factor [Tissierella carlieri]|jgi:trigger factor|uniref:trigger factor n=1 Tax=Tissierella carlieri TaxID=689904 RepID=UPI001C10D2A9|nr:trigger factor [Tissierella carlieri]MBU5311523.1 trigger factor [Tissierella carlieri]MDU5081964.1 trigger factor [Bacillota bacterium]
MKAILEKKENNKATFTFEISERNFEEALQKAYLQNRGKFNIPGFRKGKVPRKIIEMNYGAEIFYEEAINIILPNAYNDAVEELGLEPVDQPEVHIEEIEKSKPIIVKIEVAVKPEVVLGDYKSIEIEKVEYNVTDEHVEDELKSVQEMNGRIIDAGDRVVKVGDILTIDYAGYVDGAQFDGGTAEGQTLEIGSGRFIPGFEEQLVGKNKSEEVDVVVTFPEEYHAEDLKGKEATFKVTIHEIKEKELPELDDEFAKDVSEFDTIEEYKNSIREKLEEEFKNKEEVENENNLIEKVIEICEVDIPEVMIDSQLENELGEFDYRMRMQGINLEQYLQITNSTEESLKEQLRPMAEKRVRGDIILEAIGKAENIEVTEEDIDKELEKMADSYKQENKEQFIKDMRRGDLSFLETAITNQKVIELLKANAKFK